ncbi:hypothetical protein D3C85_1668450 [compost metagenome]
MIELGGQLINACSSKFLTVFVLVLVLVFGLWVGLSGSEGFVYRETETSIKDATA